MIALVQRLRELRGLRVCSRVRQGKKVVARGGICQGVTGECVGWTVWGSGGRWFWRRVGKAARLFPVTQLAGEFGET